MGVFHQLSKKATFDTEFRYEVAMVTCKCHAEVIQKTYSSSESKPRTSALQYSILNRNSRTFYSYTKKEIGLYTEPSSGYSNHVLKYVITILGLLSDTYTYEMTRCRKRHTPDQSFYCFYFLIRMLLLTCLSFINKDVLTYESGMHAVVTLLRLFPLKVMG